jgi:hypothetical protein
MSGTVARFVVSEGEAKTPGTPGTSFEDSIGPKFFLAQSPRNLGVAWDQVSINRESSHQWDEPI